MDFDAVVKDYYDSKAEYITLLEAALKDEESSGGLPEKDEKSTPQTDDSQTHDPNAPLNMPKLPRLEQSMENMDPRRASELIADLRSSIDKGNNKEAKELLARLDRGMGFPTSASSKGR